MNELTLRARAKINLTLDVVNKRPDGYHNVRMIMQSINLYDVIQIQKKATQGIIIESNLYWLPCDEKNLAYKAAKIFFDEVQYKGGIKIKLEKKIPVAAGLAGGSSDAAAVLIGLNRLLKAGFSKAKLMDMGVKLGADVPYCILRNTSLAEGIGEKLTTLAPVPPMYVLLAKPAISVSTPEVYNNLKIDQIKRRPDTEQMIQCIENQDIEGIAEQMVNVLEEVTIQRYPVIQQIKEFMLDQGALGAMMSGSGPSVFGLFRDEETAQKAYYKMKVSGLAKEVYLVTTFTKGAEHERKNR